MSVWETCLELLEYDSRITHACFTVTVKNITEVRYEENKYIILAARDSYSLLQIKNNSNGLRDVINEVVEAVCGKKINVEFILKGDEKSLNTVALASDIAYEKSESSQNTDGYSYFDLNNLKEQDKYFTFDTYIAGESNRFAKASSIQVAENPGFVDNNPFFLWGNSGLGKTHLLYAIARRIKENNPNLNILYTDCNSFVNEYVFCTKNNSYDDFRAKYYNADVLLIDDIQYLIGKTGSQNEFFNTFNNLIKAGKQIVISSDKSPKFMPELDERLTSRFSQGITMDIQPPNYETRKAILVSKLEADNISIDDSFVDYFCENFTSNIRTLIGAYKTFKTRLSFGDGNMSFDEFKSILAPLITPNSEDKLSPDFIAGKVCNYYSANYYNVTLDKLKSASRANEIKDPRNVCMYFFFELLHMTYNDIGIYFGGRKHSTVHHAINNVKSDIEAGKEIKKIIETIGKEFK
ncbi:MAG: chromosomal replication initiator protein DnaA [Clostridia bacterium]|nr:chromosomal replication initiator protein DnaA [Clostridia bacterium]